jgi:hypothetical protein
MLNPASNRATWVVNYAITDRSTGDPISLSAVSEITIWVRDNDSSNVMLSGNMSGGQVVVIGVPADGIFQWRFEASAMRNLCAKVYDVGCTLEQSGDTVQMLIDRVPVLDGVVS